VIGEAPANGNRHFEIAVDHLIFKPKRGVRAEIPLSPLKNKWARLWSAAVLMANQKKLAITVRITNEHVHVTFDDEKLGFIPKTGVIKDRYAAIDMNPNYVGVSVFDGLKLIDTKLYSLKGLTGKHASDSKLEHETREIGHDLGRWLRHLRVDKLFIEQLQFEQGDKGQGKNFNRLCNNKWKRNTFLAIIRKYFGKRQLIEINAAYTSTIGNIMYPEYPDPVASSMAIGRRGYEIFIKKSKKFYQELPSKRVLEERWKQTEWPDCSNWKELHDFIKNAGLKYRVPIPEREGFSQFQNRRSYVGVLTTS
jgi:hypothetical protein